MSRYRIGLTFVCMSQERDENILLAWDQRPLKCMLQVSLGISNINVKIFTML